jgi:Fur family ferric uptake transcriptional regulator
MSHHSDATPQQQRADFAARLRALKLRVTPPRILVLETLSAAGGHMTADAIMQHIAERYPSVNLTTVYRTLDTLVSAGLVTQTDLGNGATSFELQGDTPHHHLVCSRCGGAIEVDDALLAPLRERLLRDYGFRAETHHLAIFGLCAGCQRSQEPADQDTPLL